MFFSPKKRPCQTRTEWNYGCWVWSSGRQAREASEASLAEPRRAKRDAGPWGAPKKIDFFFLNFATRNRVTRNRWRTRNRGRTRNRWQARNRGRARNRSVLEEFSPGAVRFAMKIVGISWRAVRVGRDFFTTERLRVRPRLRAQIRLRVTRLRTKKIEILRGRCTRTARPICAIFGGDDDATAA